ncbi:MAG: hypothetical protein K8R64_08975 [Methanosarcinaceae archaeon]|nr:hypothetical protein [Methanosarcinaceae archaeon]
MNSDDIKIKQISRLLELGGTMLAQHCNTCGSPMFRYQGQMLCPVCQVMDEQEMMSDQTEKQSSKASSSSGKDVAPVSSATRPKDTTTTIQQKTADTGASSRGSSHKEIVISSDMNDDLRQLDEMIIAKISDIARQVRDENDPRRLEESFELIERGIDILKSTKTL